MTSMDSVKNKKICVELVNGDTCNLKFSVYRIQEIAKYIHTKTITLDSWIAGTSVIDILKMTADMKRMMMQGKLLIT